MCIDAEAIFGKGILCVFIVKIRGKNIFKGTKWLTNILSSSYKWLTRIHTHNACVYFSSHRIIIWWTKWTLRSNKFFANVRKSMKYFWSRCLKRDRLIVKMKEKRKKYNRAVLILPWTQKIFSRCTISSRKTFPHRCKCFEIDLVVVYFSTSFSQSRFTYFM